ncbi:MAG: hypothetical protein QUV05_02165, partial [Phycisphaerae bacterium]|nr:hypothetical protein [Phycisphaerae bacterium]
SSRAQWLNALQEVCMHTTGIGLLLHTFRGSLDDEDIVFERRAVDVQLLSHLEPLQEDVLYEFRKFKR